LEVDVFGAGELAAKLVADGGFVAVFPDAGDLDFIAEAGVTVGEGVLFEIVDGESGLHGMALRERVRVAVVGSSVFGEEIGLAISFVVRMGESEVNEEGFLGLLGLTVVQIINDLLAVPVEAGFVGFAPFGGILDDFELVVGVGITVASLASSHGLVAGFIEEGGKGFGLGILWWEELTFFSSSFWFLGDFPEALSSHDHGAGASANCAAPGAHVVGTIEDHAVLGELVDVGAIEGRTWIVDLEVEGGLVIDNDEEEVGSLRENERGESEGN